MLVHDAVSRFVWVVHCKQRAELQDMSSYLEVALIGLTLAGPEGSGV